MATMVPPPPVLASARVIAYAPIDASIPYLAKSSLYVNGSQLGRVSGLAICNNLAPDMALLMFHCDEQWNVLAASRAESVEGAIVAAESDYPGLKKHWVQVNTTIESALAYFDANFGRRCSFCGKRPFEVSRLVQSEDACICSSCVEKFFHSFGSSDGEATAV